MPRKTDLGMRAVGQKIVKLLEPLPPDDQAKVLGWVKATLELGPSIPVTVDDRQETLPGTGTRA